MIGQGAFDGLRVIELSSTIAGPFCGRLFADFGAEVIKIEPAEGDALRNMGRRKNGKSLYAASLLRNKKLIGLDMRQAEAQAVVRTLAEGADVLVENFRPGTMERWGLGYEALAAINPRLVMVRISGFGQTGPYSGRPGYGVTSEAMSGLRELTGEPGRPPSRVATSLTDYITGLYAAFGASLALHERHKTGRGQVVDAALYESAFSFTEPHVPAFGALGEVATRAGTWLPNSTPNNLYATGDGRHIQITAPTNGVFRRLLAVMGRPELGDDERFATPALRSRNHDTLDALIGAWTGGLASAEITRQLVAADVPVAPIYSVADAYSDPHYAARDMLVELPDTELGSVTVTGVVPKLSASPGRVNWPGRRLGQDTRAVLAELAGLSDEKIAELERRGIAIFAPEDTAP